MPKPRVRRSERDPLVAALALMVSGVWSLLALAGLFTHDWTGAEIVTPVMLIVAGFMFGLRVTKTPEAEGEGPNGWRPGE